MNFNDDYGQFIELDYDIELQPIETFKIKYKRYKVKINKYNDKDNNKDNDNDNDNLNDLTPLTHKYYLCVISLCVCICLF